jgi:multidrug efflux pump subunit AcrA (membrane-fusion protein)
LAEEFLEALEGDGPGGDSRRNAAWDIGYYVDALGTVRPVATFNVSSQTNGTVIAVHYAEGQTLHRGDP